MNHQTPETHHDPWCGCLWQHSPPDDPSGGTYAGGHGPPSLLNQQTCYRHHDPWCVLLMAAQPPDAPSGGFYIWWAWTHPAGWTSRHVFGTMTHGARRRPAGVLRLMTHQAAPALQQVRYDPRRSSYLPEGPTGNVAPLTQRGTAACLPAGLTPTLHILRGASFPPPVSYPWARTDESHDAGDHTRVAHSSFPTPQKTMNRRRRRRPAWRSC